ncbi:hypothetical protein Clacol_007646 [Clathrus columnatus]|uniref:Uncharacterized protein n=1 Tax=Clathrus columnatus TaxID=1419009 RepID=A0AAV5AI85_9AGAM|nr:hypothetical protein Clacol_007646 [Clathrus columnatus]
MSSSENKNGKCSSTSLLEDLNTRTDREYRLKQEWLGAKKQEEAARADLLQHNQKRQPKQNNSGLKYCNSSKTKTPNNNTGFPLENIGEEDHDDHDTPPNEFSSHAIHTPQSVLGNSRTTSPFLNKLRNWLRHRSPA